MKDLLREFSTKELRDELARRERESLGKSRIRPKTEYIELTGIVESIDNIALKYMTTTRYRPFVLWKYKIKKIKCKTNTLPYHWLESEDTFFVHKSLRKSQAPQVGDKVKLRFRKTKKIRLFDFKQAKIMGKIDE